MRGIWLVGLSSLLLGCFGLIEPLGDSAESDAGEDCPTAQWDCSDVDVSCGDTAEGAFMSVLGTCKCDRTRPVDLEDCAANEILLCASLAETHERLSCRCASSSGWYCDACASLGLYTDGQTAMSCQGAFKDRGRCGCGG